MYDGERQGDAILTSRVSAGTSDAAIDFVEMAPLVDRMRAAFFVEP